MPPSAVLCLLVVSLSLHISHAFQPVVLSSLPSLIVKRSSLRCGRPMMSAAGTDQKSKLFQLCRSGPQNGVDAPEELVSQVMEAAKALEECNPTADLSTAAAMTGSWDLIFTTNKGASAGILGPFVGDVKQIIDMEGGFYLNKLILLNGIIEAVLQAEWRVESDQRWAVIFNDIAFSVFGIEIFKKEFAGGLGSRDDVLNTLDTLAKDGYQRSAANGGWWDMTYTDEDLRVLYTSGVGTDPTKKSLFVLARTR